MTTYNHTEISNGAAGNSLVVNTPLGALDAAIGDISAFSETSLSAIIDTVIDTDGSMKAGAVDVSAALADNVVSAAKIADNVIGATYVAGTDLTLEELSDKSPIEGPDDNNTSAEDVTTDSADLEALGVTALGNVRIARSEHRAIGDNNIGQDALTDARDRVAMALDQRGGLRGDFRPNYLGADINHIVITGQSLSVGDWGGPALSTTQPYGNIQFIGGGSDNMGEFVPLVEPCYRDVILKHGSSGDGESTVETMASGMANLVSALVYDGTADRRYHRSLCSIHGIGASDYDVIKRGGSGDAYLLGMEQITAAHNLALQKRLSYRVAALCLVHGEADRANATYDADLLEMQKDYEADVWAITGQQDPVPLLYTQFSSWTAYSTTTSAGALAQYRAAKNNPGRLFLVGPQYFLDYNAADLAGKHLANTGYRWMGEYFAKVYQRVVIERKAWWPVMPSYIWRDGADIYIQFHVPKPPLQFDVTNVTDPSGGSNFKGFEYTDASSGAVISSVTIYRENVVKVTLNGDPGGATGKTIRYAYTGTSGALAGPTTGPRGNLCDSDTTRSLYGNNLRNWGVSFSEAIS